MNPLFRRNSPSTELRIDISSNNLEKVVFTTLDIIAGRVVFAPVTPIDVEDILVDFVGHASTWLDPVTPGIPRRNFCHEVRAQLYIKFLISTVSNYERRDRQVR